MASGFPSQESGRPCTVSSADALSPLGLACGCTGRLSTRSRMPDTGHIADITHSHIYYNLSADGSEEASRVSLAQRHLTN